MHVTILLEIITSIKFMIMEVLHYGFPTWGGGSPGGAR